MRSSPVAIEVEHASAKVRFDMRAASKTRLGRVNEAVLQLDLHPPQDLRSWARALHADRVPKREIARLVGRDPATIRRWLRPRPAALQGQAADARVASASHRRGAGLGQARRGAAQLKLVARHPRAA